MDALRSPVLAALGESALRALLQSAVERRFRRESILFLTGDDADRLYLVSEGVVKLSRRGPDGRELIVRLAVPGDLVGDLGAFEATVHETDAIAAGPVWALSLDAACFRRILADEPAALRSLVRVLSNRCRAMTANIHERGTAAVPARLAGKLLHMALLLGRARDGVLEFEVPLRQADLASFAGTSRESVSKTLKRFESEGLVCCNGRKLRILRPAALERIRCAGRA